MQEKSKMIRLILCDDQDIITEGMKIILSAVADFAVVGVAHDGAEGVERGFPRN